MRKEHRVCYSDEHYIPTLLAVLRRDNETDCQGLWMGEGVGGGGCRGGGGEKENW